MESYRTTPVSTVTRPGLGLLLKCEGRWELLGMKPHCDQGSDRMTAEQLTDELCVTGGAVVRCRGHSGRLLPHVMRSSMRFLSVIVRLLGGGSDALRPPTGRTMVSDKTASLRTIFVFFYVCPVHRL